MINKLIKFLKQLFSKSDIKTNIPLTACIKTNTTRYGDADNENIIITYGTSNMSDDEVVQLINKSEPL